MHQIRTQLNNYTYGHVFGTLRGLPIIDQTNVNTVSQVRQMTLEQQQEREDGESEEEAPPIQVQPPMPGMPGNTSRSNQNSNVKVKKQGSQGYMENDWHEEGEEEDQKEES